MSSPGFRGGKTKVVETVYPHSPGVSTLQLIGPLHGIPRRVLESKMDQFLGLFSRWSAGPRNPYAAR